MRSRVALVLGLFDTGLGAVRSLGRVGIPVVGLDSQPEMPGFKSRYCTAEPCPDPVQQPQGLRDFLLKQRSGFKQSPILFPTSDAFVLFLSRNRDVLQTAFRFVMPPTEVVEAIVNKRRQYEMAEWAGIPYPRTFYPESLEDVERIQDEVQYPAFIKPYYGHLWRERFGGTHKGFKVHNAAELVRRFADIFPTGLQAMVQAIIPGPNTNHFKVCAYVSQSGEPLAVFTLRKIRQYPTEFGVGTLVESQRFPELAELGLRFLHGIGYRGIGSIEFKRDERDGQLNMIELNPRLWQQNIQATDCGINFPLIQYLDLTGQPPAPQTDFKEGVRWLDAMADFQAFWAYFRHGELSPWAWIRSWVGARSFATFAWDDLGPFCTANHFGIKYLRAPLYAMRQCS